MPDLDWLYDPNFDSLIRDQTRTIFSALSNAFGVFQLASETQAGTHLISSFLYSRLLQVRDSNYQREMNKAAATRRTIDDAFASIKKFVSRVFDLPDVRRGVLPQLQDLFSV